MRDFCDQPLEAERVGEMLEMRKGGWSARVPLADLPKWVGLYRWLRDRKGGRFRAAYSADVAALEAVEAQIDGHG